MLLSLSLSLSLSTLPTHTHAAVCVLTLEAYRVASSRPRRCLRAAHVCPFSLPRERGAAAAALLTDIERARATPSGGNRGGFSTRRSSGNANENRFPFAQGERKRSQKRWSCTLSLLAFSLFSIKEKLEIYTRGRREKEWYFFVYV